MEGADFLSWSVELLKITFQNCLNWFTLIMDKTGMLSFYFAGIMIVFGVGFLLARFGSLNSGVSDVAASSIGKFNKSRDEALARKSGAWRAYSKKHNSH